MTPLVVASLVTLHCVAHGTVCAAPAKQLPFPNEGIVRVAEDSIGTATMEADGTIALQLIARGPGAMRGEGVLRYAVSDPKYKDILEHVGPLKPGEIRPVRPWPD